MVIGTAHADPEALFKQGRDLVEAGDWDGGCAKFETAYHEAEKPGIAANLAACAEHFGDFAKAWNLYQTAAAKFGDDPRAAQSRERAEGVAKRATVVVIGVPDPTLEGLAITIGDREVKPAREIREVVNPGEIELAAHATGRAPWHRTIQGKAGESAVVEVVLAPEAVREPERTTTSTHRRRSRVYIAAGMGAVGVGTFIVSLVLAKSAKSDYDDVMANPMYCMGGACNDRGFELIDDAQHRANIATAIGIAGGVLAVGAVAVYFTAPRDTVVAPIATTNGGGVTMTTRF